MLHGSESGKTCGPSCALAPAPIVDQQIPARALTAASVLGVPLLLSVVSFTIKYPVWVPIIRDRDLNHSPPLAGCPSQAVLRLWLI